MIPSVLAAPKSPSNQYGTLLTPAGPKFLIHKRLEFLWSCNQSETLISSEKHAFLHQVIFVSDQIKLFCLSSPLIPICWVLVPHNPCPLFLFLQNLSTVFSGISF